MAGFEIPGLKKAYSSVTGNSSKEVSGGSDSLTDIYPVTNENWYKTLPYGFTFHDRNTEKIDPGVNDSTTFFLPISPQNINVTTQFATNVMSTLYGVVEEHSAIKFYDISIVGTTGITPQYVNEKNANTNSTADSGRTSFTSIGRTNFEIGGFLPAVSNTLNQIVDTAIDIVNAFDNGVPDTAGVTPEITGYAAFHNFYRFLLKYKKDAAGIGKAKNKRRTARHSLTFFNYKDGIKYDCVPVSFTLTRSADNPMLYNYSISMRCYNLRDINAEDQTNTQAGLLGLVDKNSPLESLSAFSTAAGAASSAASLISGLF